MSYYKLKKVEKMRIKTSTWTKIVYDMDRLKRAKTKNLKDTINSCDSRNSGYCEPCQIALDELERRGKNES